MSKAKKSETFTYVNVQAKSGLVRNAQMEGRSFLVAPTVMMVEGVHNGQAGPILYTSEELSRVPVSANHKPVVVYHPIRNGLSVSACDPVELTSRKIGMVLNSTYENGFKGEAWLEPDRMAVVDNRVAEAIQNNTMMEVSIGVFMNLDNTEGTWHNPVTNEEEAYIGIARDMVFDHLAVLPDMIGACSIADGGGLLRVNAAGTDDGEISLVCNDVDVTEDYIRIRQKSPGVFHKDSFRTISITAGVKAVVGKLKNPPEGKEGSMVIQTYLFDKKKFTTATAKAWVKQHNGVTAMSAALFLNEIGHESLRRLLRQKLIEVKGDNSWVEEVYDEYFIYEVEGHLFKQSYSQTDGTIEFVGDASEVVKVSEYRTLDGKFVGSNENVQHGKEKNMDKKKVVDDLIANEKTPWTEDHRKMLMDMAEPVLEHLSKAGEPAQPAQPAVTPQMTVPPVQNANPAAPTVVNFKNAAEYLQVLPSDVRAFVQNGLSVLREETERLVNVIMANSRNTFTKEWLLTCPIEQLRAMSRLATNDDSHMPEMLTPNFAGQASTFANVDPNNKDETEPLLVPSMSAALAEARK